MDPKRLRKAPNIAIVGSTSLLGKELREMLESRALPIGRLALLETEEYAGLLQEFAGEIQITQVISPQTFEDIDIVFFTCGPEIMHSYVASGARFPDLAIDLTQAGPEGTVYLHGISDQRLLRSHGYFVNPHPAAIVIGRVLSYLHSVFALEGADITILEPSKRKSLPVSSRSIFFRNRKCPREPNAASSISCKRCLEKPFRYRPSLRYRRRCFTHMRFPCS
jgi:hypothetical protein